MSPNQPGTARPAQKEDFLDAVAERLGVADAPAIQMIMFGFEALRDTELRQKLGYDAMQDVRSSIVGALTEVAADGQVCRLDATSYGVLSPIDLDQDQMIATVAEATEEFWVSESDLGTAVESVELDVDADAEPERRWLAGGVVERLAASAAMPSKKSNALTLSVCLKITVLKNNQGQQRGEKPRRLKTAPKAKEKAKENYPSARSPNRLKIQFCSEIQQESTGGS